WESARERNPTSLIDEDMDMSLDYLPPRWYQKSMNFVDAEQVRFGNEFEVYARIMPWMTYMEHADIDVWVSDGLRIVDGEPLWKGCGGSNQKCDLVENIPKCKIREMRFKVKWESQPEETQRIQVSFQFNFPHEELLQYVKEDKGFYYDNEGLKLDLLEYISNFSPRDDDSLMLIIN
ncbi:MAG: hypothetical protein KAS32_11280, partial [Candidatus Peribacteraceae bacterium]|nr:hypothetical protein [Candidatus Peribacteraceae bacterium]